MYYVYKIVKQNEIEYVGITNNITNRINQHKRNAFWLTDKHKVYYAEVPNKTIATCYEVYLINKLNPTYNKQNNAKEDVSDMSFPNYEWHEIDIIKKSSNKLIKKQNNNFDCLIGQICSLYELSYGEFRVFLNFFKLGLFKVDGDIVVINKYRRQLIATESEMKETSVKNAILSITKTGLLIRLATGTYKNDIKIITDKNSIAECLNFKLILEYTNDGRKIIIKGE